MNVKAIVASLLLVLFLLSPSALAGTVTRGFSSTTLSPGDQLTVTLTVDVDEATEDYYAIEEDYPDSWVILDNGGLNDSETGLLKKVVIENAQDTQYQYILQAPSQTGIHTWSGTYMFEGMSSESNIPGQTQVDVIGCTDADGDSYSPEGGICGPVDCDDNPLACGANCYPGHAELCDSYDNDCNTQTDEGCDDDLDDYCDSSMTVVGTPPVCPNGGGDCDDTDININPGAQEICDNIDNNCDGNTDYFTTPGDLTQSCGPANETGICQYGTQICTGGTWGICSGAVYPEQEVCDREDDDCNGIIDDVGGGDSVATTHCQCYNGGSPLSDEVCPLNGIDDDCNGEIDEDMCDCVPFVHTHLCQDQAGVCAGSYVTCPAGGVWPTPYCDDTIYLAHNSNYESGSETSCDNLDNDCDGDVDEGLTATFYRDFDGDGYGDSSSTTDACTQPSGYVSNPQDCNDTNSSINPDATEICNGIDDNCDGNVDFLVVPGDLGCAGDVVITADYYDGRTTNFTDVADTTNIVDMTLEKSSYGMIEFLQPVNISYSTNLNPPFTLISENLVKINSTLLPFMNAPARIHLYSLSFLNPVVLRDNQPCASSICQIISYSGGNLTFNVTGFTEYSATGSCSDGTLYGECSTQKPRYCFNGTLVNRAGTCGCPSGYEVSGNDCIEEGDGNGGNGGGGGGGGGPVCTSGEQNACEREGVCKPSYQTCVNGFWGPCEGPDPEPEVCDGLDNDCNGLVDDGITCLCMHGDTRACGPSEEAGLCKFGISQCVYGLWGGCQGAVMPAPELCDGLDNDCDGEVDEECASGICGEGLIVPEFKLGMVTPQGCLCGGEIRTSGYCCSGLYYEDGCPFQWSLLILAGVIILIVLYAVIFYFKLTSKGPQPV